MHYLILFFAVISIIPIQAMQQSHQFIVKSVRVPEQPGKALYVPSCGGLLYEHPTFNEVADSFLGLAIVDGNLGVVKNTFDGPSGWRYLIHWALMEQDRQWVRAVHGLSIGLNMPSHKTGEVAYYLWQKVKKGYKEDCKTENIPYSKLESKGACLILNAYQNGHYSVLDEMLKSPFLKYGICESIRSAVRNDDIKMLQYLLDHGAQCNGDVLIEALKAKKDAAAFWLIKAKVGLNWCDWQGSALHAAVLENSILLSRLIQEISSDRINCYSYSVINSNLHDDKHIHKETALDLLFYQRERYKNDENFCKQIDDVIAAFMMRGARTWPASSEKHRKLLLKYQLALKLVPEQICQHNGDGKFIDCLPAKKILL